MLRWMSEIGTGRVRDLRGRLEWLARTEDYGIGWNDTGLWVRDISLLGHAEVDWARDRWATACPALVRLPSADGLAVLAGARRRETLARLADTDLSLHEVLPEVGASGLPLPTAVFAQFDSQEALRDAAQGAEITYAGCAAERIAARLAKVRAGDEAAPPATTSDSLERRTGPGPRIGSRFRRRGHPRQTACIGRRFTVGTSTGPFAPEPGTAATCRPESSLSSHGAD